MLALRHEYKANTERNGTPTSTPPCPSSNPHLIGGGGGISEKEVRNTGWRSIRPGGGDLPTTWFAGARKTGSLTLWSFGMCARFNKG